MRKLSEKDREYRKQSSKKWKLAHPEASKAANREYSRKWRLAHPGATTKAHNAWKAAHPETSKESHNKSAKQQRILNPLRMQARRAVGHYKKKHQDFQKPCLVCQNPKSEAHHHLGYNKEHQLHVQWFCKIHHVQIHKEV